MSMFCNQCEQTARGEGCTTVGVCGKTEDVAALQDLLVNATRGLAVVANAAQALGIDVSAEGAFTDDALFQTLTNVDFDPETISASIDRAIELREALKARVGAAGGSGHYSDQWANFSAASSVAEKVAQGMELGSPWDTSRDADVQALQQTTLFGLKGVAAYESHARILGKTDPAIYAYIFKALAALGDTSLDLNAWVGLALECGTVNLRAMEILDEANIAAYGSPTITAVQLGHKAGKAILVSGHDLADVAALLKQTEGTGVNVYSHGEILPAHAYPELHKYPHFAGHYGTAWQNQRAEFEAFPGAILLTTNCLMPPRDSYKDRVFTAGPVNFPGLTHVSRDDFSAVIEKAQSMPGFAEDTDADEVLVGFGHDTVMSVAPTVIDAVKSGAIRHFFLVGGCDGAKPGRNYFSDFVDQAPADTIVLTLACGKFRFFDRKLGEIGGLPRLMDVGQCNDAYSAVQIAVALANAFECEVNELPLSMIVSWYEQKAVAILLSLLSLGIKGIRLGPSLPAFITPNVLGVLVENFDIKPIGESAAVDINEILGTQEVAV
jgi:hydroxylamine reductase